MRISEMLQAIASWLESPHNEAILISEYDEDCLNVVAGSCIEAAGLLRKAASKVESIEPQPESNLTPESIDKLAAIAAAFDESGDSELICQASVIDELLLTIAANPKAITEKKAAEDKRIEDLKSKYNGVSSELKELNKIVESEKAIEKSKMTEPVVLGGSLSTRTCMDHPGAQMQRLSDNEWKCGMDGKVYNYQIGFTLNNGMKVPGGDVTNQTKMITQESQSIFDTRDSIMHGFKP